MDFSNKILDNGLPNNGGDSLSTLYSTELYVYPFRKN